MPCLSLIFLKAKLVVWMLFVWACAVGPLETVVRLLYVITS